MTTHGHGEALPERFEAFDLTGGRPALDFVNTLEGRATEPRDRLSTYGDLLSWARQEGLLDEGPADELRQEAEARAGEADRALAAARTLREALYEIFSAMAAEGSPAAEAVARLNDALPEAMKAFRLAAAEPGVEWRWTLAGEALERILALVVRDAAELLTSPEVRRVRQCQSETCAWLFLDQSRNRSRRWCDMKVCGNRAKARRHYERSKTGA